MPLFHYALRPGGVLFLGASESVDQHEDLFSTVDRKWKIFRRVNARRQVLDAFPIGRGKTRPVEAPPAERREVAGGPRPRHARRAHAADALRSTRAWSWTSAARPSTSPAGPVSIWSPRPASRRTAWSEMAREDLRHDLTAVLRESAKTADEAVRRRVRVRINGGTRFVTIAVTPITEPRPLRGLFFVTFEAEPSAGPRRLGGIGGRGGVRGRPPRRSWTSLGRRSGASSTRWRKRRRTTRSSRRPTRSSRAPTRSSRAATRSWRRGGRRCNRSTRSWRRSIPSSERRSTTSPTRRAIYRTCSTARTPPRSSWMPT